ncbi:MAG TPA: glucosidase [Pirellulales bacterium]|nr:glucosidase [Pirellulales bacterium]
MQKTVTTAEHARLAEILDQVFGWRRWGPYVSERSWATVREDYSPDGNAWQFLPHELARSKAYRWGEDAIAGICDRYQILLFAPAFWNGNDPILKERLFGLTPFEGNHGEDVKEYYFHVDNTPTHSYMKYVYKYPQAEFPYRQLIEANRRRAGDGREFELLDTGVFDGDRYFDITIEYAKADEEDICIRIEAVNLGPDAASLHIVPHLWFRNTWCWGKAKQAEPVIDALPSQVDCLRIVADDLNLDLVENLPIHYRLGKRMLYAPLGGEPIFTDNETNVERVFGPGWTNSRPFVKDAFHRWIVDGEPCTNPAGRGTKAAIHYQFDAVPPGGSVVLRLRLSDKCELSAPLAEVDDFIADRRLEADEFYAAIHPPEASDDERLIQRQALAGMLWNKQCYIFDVSRWLDGDNPDWPPAPARAKIRNQHWRHLNSLRIMTLPDKWEYPWFAAWDLAFQCVTLALVDPQYAMDQLWVLLFEQFQHPNGQIPAYEWEFSDLNPPVHAWAVWRIYNMARRRTGHADRGFLERCFHKLLMNFAWWVNKVDSQGNNVFEGGFLGLDNITVFDRSVKFADGVVLEQSDATGWMGMFCLNLMRIALELAKENREYERLATKFFQHFVYVAAAMKHMGGRDYQLWDESDGFFYDVLRFPDGRFQAIRVRSLVGLIPLCAVERLEEDYIKQFAGFYGEFQWFLKHRQQLVGDLVNTIESGGKTTHVLSIVNRRQLERLLGRVFDPGEFLSDYGLRSLSKAHEEHPFEFDGKTVRYEPAEAICKIKGGNSNWRGPIWFPTAFLLIESLRKLGKAWGPEFTIENPNGGGRVASLALAAELADRHIGIFSRDAANRRRVFGDCERFQNDPHWRDLILFYEYFHGDNGAGLGASHQTGWTALVSSLIDEWRR